MTRSTLFALILASLFSSPPLHAQQEGESSQVAEPTVQVDSFGVRVQPQLEFIIPYGVISQRADIPLGGSIISTQADFDLASSAVAGEVGLRRRFGPWVPGVRAYQRSNSEGIAQPRITGGEIRLAPEDRYLERERGVVGDLDFFLREDIVGLGSVEVQESVETLLSEPEAGESVQSSSFEITPSIGLELRSLRIDTPEESADLIGSYLRFTLSNRFVRDFSGPAELTGRVATLFTHEPRQRLHLEHQLSATTPLAVWDRSLFSPISLGGFDSLRGYGNGEITETRGVLSRNTVTWQPFPGQEASFDSPVIDDGEQTVRVRVHNFKMLLAVDALLAQEAPELDSRIAAYLSLGPGASLTVSAGESIHFDLRGYVAVPYDEWEDPVFYLQGSIFSVTVE